MSRSEPVLVTLPISHFCEKARWALDRAGVAYVERRHMQIIHQFAARLAGGGKSVPVLKTGDGVFTQSHDIMVYADSFLPEPARLYPADKALRAEVVALEQRFDAVLGVEGRRWLYHEVFKDVKPFASYNLEGVPAWERLAFPFVVAPAKIYINHFLDIDDATAARALQLVDEELDAVAELLSDGRPYLTGERFTAADLAFAALSAPLIVPVEYGTPLPQPEQLPERMAAPVRAWREHPAGSFALRMFAERRHALAAAPAAAA
jgi:glutathione S-transferase